MVFNLCVKREKNNKLFGAKLVKLHQTLVKNSKKPVLFDLLQENRQVSIQNGAQI